MLALFGHMVEILFIFFQSILFSHHANAKFTIQFESDDKLLLLALKRGDCILAQFIYRKPTHRDRLMPTRIISLL